MGLFDKPEVTVLKESSDAKEYLNRLEDLIKNIEKESDFYQRIEKEIAITKAGIIGEEQIMFELKNSGMNLVVLHDIYIEDSIGNGAQIDYLVITPNVSVIIECKNLFGNIEINNKGDFIRTIEFNNRRYKEGIYSPITQNERHMRVYKNCRVSTKGFLIGKLFDKMFEKYNKSLIVLANPKTVVNDRYAPSSIKKQVLRVDRLVSVLRNMESDVKYKKKEMLALGEEILSMNIESRKDYFVKFEELQKEYMQEKMKEQSQKIEKEKIEVKDEKTDNRNNKFCPRCGNELVKRIAKKGKNQGNQFWGCSSYPKCRYTEDL